MPFTATTAACIAVAAWFLRRLYRLITGDCDLSTLTARLKTTTFRGKVVWITGASSGIGAALATPLARQGALLILSARRKDKLKELADSLPCPRDNVYVLPLDMRADYVEIESVASTVAAVFGRLDFVFNNAGVSTRVTANDLDLEHIEDVLRVDFLAPVALARACLPSLRETPGGGGTIVNTVSIAAIISTPLRSTYCASKAAMAAYFKSLALEEPNVRVLNVYPGSVKTPIAISAITADGKTFGKTDVNIEKGLDPQRVAERMLAAVSAGLSTSWIAKPKELTAVRLAVWFPGLWDLIATKRAAAYRRAIEES